MAENSCSSEEPCDCSSSCFKLGISNGSVEPREYSIFESLYPTIGLKNDLVVNQRTDSTILIDFSDLFSIHNMDSSIYYDYKNKNSATFLFDQEAFSESSNFILISNDAREYLFQNENILNPWECFFYCYPKSTGLTSFSRIGFGKDSLYALMGISFRSPSRGSDINYCLRKGENGWEIIWTKGNTTALQ